MMETEEIPETLVFNSRVALLIARVDFSTHHIDYQFLSSLPEFLKS
jgi:hypothetical protein